MRYFYIIEITFTLISYSKCQIYFPHATTAATTCAVVMPVYSAVSLHPLQSFSMFCILLSEHSFARNHAEPFCCSENKVQNFHHSSQDPAYSGQHNCLILCQSPSNFLRSGLKPLPIASMHMCSLTRGPLHCHSVWNVPYPVLILILTSSQSTSFV